MSSRFGPAPDVDGDGRFTVLLSSWLDHLGGGRYAVDGFVRVADLDRAFRSPLGNQCDMMYLSTSLKADRTFARVLAHEYMHAVACGQKGRRRSLAVGSARRGRMARRGDRSSGRRLAAGFRLRISTTASVRFWQRRSDISLSWTTTTRPTCSAAMEIAGARICF